MRADVILFGGDSHGVESRLAGLPGASQVPIVHRAGRYFIQFANRGSVYLGRDGGTLHSDMPEAEHNAWAEAVFDVVCDAVDGDVELLDRFDKVIRSRKVAAA